jgi:hypothetical protein
VSSFDTFFLYTLYLNQVMFLPKRVRKLIVIGLLPLVFLLGFPATSLALETPNKPAAPEKEGGPQQYYLVPIPKAGEEQDPSITPIPIPEDDPRIQQAFLHGQLWDFFTDIFGGLVGIVSGVLECVSEPFGCAAGGLFGLYKFGMTVVQSFLLEQIGGRKAVEAVAVVGTGDKVAINEFLQEALTEENPAEFGLLGFASSATPGLLALPLPIKSDQYLASINPFKPAEAQLGGGFNTLSNSNVVLEIWRKVRNVSYVLAVAVLVVIGFMIMLRIPIGPRNVVTVQNALPRIAIALLLITFSFTISGVMIDLARIVKDVLIGLVDVPILAPAAMAVIFTIIPVIFGVLFFSGGGAAPLVVGILIVVLLLALILAICTIIIFFIIAYKLITRYVIFLLLTMFAPLFFLFGALPKGEGAVIYWFKRAAAALIAIPATALVVELSFAIGFSGVGTLSVPDLDLMGGIVGVAFAWVFLAPLVGLGMFFYATKVPDMVDEIFGVGRGGGGGRGFGPGAVLGYGTGALSTLGTANRAAPMLAGWAQGGVGAGGIRGRIAGGLYSLARPFATVRGVPMPTTKELLAKRGADIGSSVERTAQAGAKQRVVKGAADSAAAGTSAGTGPAKPFSEGSTRLTAERGGGREGGSGDTKTEAERGEDEGKKT